MRSLHHWRQYRKDHGLELDAVRVIDQGPDGEHVWHVHILGFGIAVDLAVEPSVIERAGGYGFIKTEWVDASSRKSYLLRRLRGYIGAKESGWRRLRVCGARAADAESVALADRAKLSDLRSRFGDSGEQVHGRVLRFVLIGSRGRVQVLAESLASRTGGGLRGAEYWRSRNVGRIES